MSTVRFSCLSSSFKSDIRLLGEPGSDLAAGTYVGYRPKGASWRVSANRGRQTSLLEDSSEDEAADAADEDEVFTLFNQSFNKFTRVKFVIFIIYVSAGARAFHFLPTTHSPFDNAASTTSSMNLYVLDPLLRLRPEILAFFCSLVIFSFQSMAPR